LRIFQLFINNFAFKTFFVSVAPSLITTPADQTVLESATATFHCNASGNPAPKITWIKDGETVGQGDTLMFETNRNHSGKYWCSAENGLNSTVNASANLDVKCKLNNVDFAIYHLYQYNRRCGDLMVSALVSGSSGLGSSPGWGHCIVFLGKTLYTLCHVLTKHMAKPLELFQYPLHI